MSLSDKTLYIICGTLEAGGAERVISVLSAFLIDNFKHVQIITWRDAPVFYQFDKSISIVSVPKESKKRLVASQMFWFRNYVRKTRPDIVLSFLAPFNMLTLLSLLGVRIPVVVAERVDPRNLGRFWGCIRNFVYRFADVVLVQTQSIKEYFPPSIRKKCQIIYNPVFIKENLIGKALESPKNKKIINIGRLGKSKNQILLIEAFKDVHELFPEFKLVIYGEGKMRPVLTQYIRQLSLEDSVELAGSKKDVYSYMLDADLFVMSSDYEGMSNALIEAMCLGLPCVSTKVCGAVDLIENRVNGILVEVRNKGELVKAICDVLVNVDLRQKLGRNGIGVYQILAPEKILVEWGDALVNIIERYRK